MEVDEDAEKNSAVCLSRHRQIRTGEHCDDLLRGVPNAELVEPAPECLEPFSAYEVDAVRLEHMRDRCVDRCELDRPELVEPFRDGTRS